MNIKVISIDPAHENILSFLYPEYSVVNSVSQISKFITHRDIKSKREREVLEIQYSDCIFISGQIFDEYWDADKIKQESVNFAHRYFKSRKSVIKDLLDNLVDNCINFMFDMVSEQQENNLNELFDSYGSVIFVKKFINQVSIIPLPVLCSAMNTFIYKILNSDSVYYKKKAINLAPKIRANFSKALDSYLLRSKDNYGLSDAKFYSDLVQ